MTVTVAHWRHRLAQPAGGSGITAVDLVVAEMSHEGQTGLGFSYQLGGSAAGAVAIAREMASLVRPGEAPQAQWRRLAATLHRTGRGAGFVALAALDVAAWDLHARRLGVPLGVAMGGAARSVPVYGSGFFHAGQEVGSALDACRRYADAGMTAVKPRVAGADRRLIMGVAADAPGSLRLMFDATEKCDPIEAAALMRLAHEVNALFVEEPMPAGSLAAYASLARTSPVPIATGEHLQGVAEAHAYLTAQACALVQPDLSVMGGLTECLRVAALAEVYGVGVAPHFLPDLFVHLAAAAPNVTWLEHFPLLEPLFDGAHGADRIAPVMTMPDRPGHGLAWAPHIAGLIEVVSPAG